MESSVGEPFMVELGSVLVTTVDVMELLVETTRPLEVVSGIAVPEEHSGVGNAEGLSENRYVTTIEYSHARACINWDSQSRLP